jgi:hypothetical protein
MTQDAGTYVALSDIRNATRTAYYLAATSIVVAAFATCMAVAALIIGTTKLYPENIELMFTVPTKAQLQQRISQ